MPFEPRGPLALVFPGQGAQRAEMLEPFSSAPSFDRHFGTVRRLLGRDPLEGDLTDNATSSLLTVLASVLALETLDGPAPVAAAGYSVGQWTALYAAGCLDADALFSLVFDRARLMDECIAAAPPSGMLAVIGVKTDDIRRVCEDSELLLLLTNDNAPAQATLGGTLEALENAERALAVFKPKKLVRVPVAGAWHSPLLEAAIEPLAARIESIGLTRAKVPVIDNTTGEALDEEAPTRLRSLAMQVAMPVLWRQGVATLVSMGAGHMLEVGYGDLLTKYGFFISRAVRHEAMVRSPRR